ncbi:MAG: hypothetical protein M3O30_09415 [Planctomycetota bacterium]|nr:hypothetical protein [Planctomycetota bacterium]
MRKKVQLVAKHRWVDVFETTYFAGRMRRILGPVQLKSISAGSMIVGPEVRVELYGLSKGQPFKLILGPKRIIPDLPAVLHGAKIHSIMISSDLTATRCPIPKPGETN